MYFTSSARYALPYYANKPDPALLVCFVVTGNSFPVVEHPYEHPASFLGLPLRGGYQVRLKLHHLLYWVPSFYSYV